MEPQDLRDRDLGWELHNCGREPHVVPPYPARTSLHGFAKLTEYVVHSLLATNGGKSPTTNQSQAAAHKPVRITVGHFVTGQTCKPRPLQHASLAAKVRTHAAA